MKTIFALLFTFFMISIGCTARPVPDYETPQFFPPKAPLQEGLQTTSCQGIHPTDLATGLKLECHELMHNKDCQANELMTRGLLVEVIYSFLLTHDYFLEACEGPRPEFSDTDWSEFSSYKVEELYCYGLFADPTGEHFYPENTACTKEVDFMVKVIAEL